MLRAVTFHFKIDFLCQFQLNHASLSSHSSLFGSTSLGTGKRFDRKKVRIAEKVEPFSGRTFFLQFFFVHMEPEVLQQWQTTYFKACSK